MNKNIVAIVISMSFFGCAKDSVQPVVPNSIVVVQSPPCTNPDGFDKAGQVAAHGARWSYNKAKNAWEWVTSDETKEEANALLNSAKEKVEEKVDQLTDSK